MHTWQWRTWEGLPYLTCSLLEPWSHGFFTQQFYPRSPSEMVQALAPAASIYRVKQVHGNAVLSTNQISAVPSPSQGDAELALSPADGLLTTGTNQAVWVCSADCTPVLIADQQTGQVSAIHAGWRGTAAQIVPIAIAQLQAQGSQLTDLRVALGPAIAGTVYQVTSEVGAEVGATVAPAGTPNNPDDIVQALMQLPNPPLLPDPEPQRVRLDVRRVIALQLQNLGLKEEQIAIAPHCTYQEPESFFSYRRDGQKKVQWSGIVSS